MATPIGVFPVYDNIFKIGIAGRASEEEEMVTIADMESFSVSIDGGVEEWKAMEDEGWTSRLTTAKSITIGLNGKRNVGDPGNDYIADCAWKTGSDCDSKFEWTLPNGAKLEMDCVINATNVAGGDSTNVAALECEILSHKKPTYTPAPTA